VTRLSANPVERPCHNVSALSEKEEGGTSFQKTTIHDLMLAKEGMGYARLYRDQFNMD
jgi:hypothetical protein